MIAEGNILKMRAEYDTPVQYFLPVGDAELCMNDLIGKEIRFIFGGQVNCISCGKVTRTSYGQGFCYNCLQTAPEAAESVLQPQLSKAHFGIARDMEYAEKYDLIEHVVYLVLSPGLKVGVTRHHQVPVRWIDQGAAAAMPLAKTPNRHIAGVMEGWLKQFYSDKTNWRDMLTNKQAPETDPAGEKRKALELLPAELKKYAYEPDEITRINYPVLRYPENVTPLSLDKTPQISGKLTGIRGQYLIFDGGYVLGIRKHNGYLLTVEW
ncbi:MAG TPA: DUF2797 domain-containing protein [Prolixibacteraceae bacterium]|nr:DUF2797 domain-containing protein [Prolixibacteraceae bacterium]HPI33908.1 DUF2797 domain-containing protein [Prolixibacteraceae bacterium]